MDRRQVQKAYGVAAAIVAVTGLSAGGFYATRGSRSVEVTAAPLTRGSVLEVVSATGTLEAVTTVQVGAQVTGSVQQLGADFNSVVRRGQLLARLDPAVFESQAEQARASLARAEADAARLRVALADAEKNLARAHVLAARQLLAPSEFDAADVARRSAASEVASADAAILQARASLAQAELNVRKTLITSPIDGIVVSRDVDVGQTVSASLQAPTLFVLAANLSQLRARASVDESDVARVREGQPVRFQVDAFPDRDFAGVVAQVRLQPVTDQNVVTYAVLIDVANPGLELRPGMTTSVTIEVARRDNVLRAPTAALRFQPGGDVLAALKQPDTAKTALPGTTSKRARDSAGGGSGALWVMADGRLSAVPVRSGLSDGSYAELTETALTEGAQVVTAAKVAGQASAKAISTASSPLLASPPRPGPPPGR